MYGQFGDHEFEKKVAAVRKLAEQCWQNTLKKHLKMHVFDNASSLDAFSAILNAVTVHVEPNSRKKTISIGLRSNSPHFA